MSNCINLEGTVCSILNININPKYVCSRCQDFWINGEPPKMKNRFLEGLVPKGITDKKPNRIMLFIKALYEWIKRGCPITGKRLFKQRLKICKDCKFWNKNRCMKCGCFVTKLYLSTEKCPIGKW